MTLKSKFNKGNIIMAYDVVAKSERTLEVATIKRWEAYNGFTYAFRDLGSNVPLYEEYDELDFETQFEIKRIFIDVIDYKNRDKKKRKFDFKIHGWN